MVVGVRKNMMLLFENKLSYIFCAVGAGSRTLNKPDGLSNSTTAVGWHVYCAWYFTMCFVKFESTVVTFDSGVVGLEINVWHCFWKCEKLVFVPLQKFSAPVRPYHWGTLTQLPMTHLLHNASGWQVPGQVALSGNHSVNCKQCAKYPWLCSVIQQI